MTGPASLSVILGTFNRLESLKRCIISIVAQTHSSLKIYVADAGSTDGTVDYLTAIASNTIIPVLQGEKLGQARGYNALFRQVETPYVCWISDDNEVVNHGLDVGIDLLESHRAVGMVGLKVADMQGPFAKAPYIGGITAAGVLNINQGMLRTEVLREVGYFSELFGLYGIDADLTTKVLYAGHDVVMTRAIALQHYRDWADVSTDAGAKLKANQDRSLRIYKEKYASCISDDPTWRLKKKLWDAVRARLGKRLSLNSREPIFGAIPRDWFNVLQARYISPLDPWIHALSAYHLRQRIPRRELRSLKPLEDSAIAATY